MKYLDIPFGLNRLDAATLDTFIAVEAPSQHVTEGLDGMYVYILEALQAKKESIPNARKIIPLIKLIIDEGTGHWERYERIKATLAGISEDDYLRKISSQAPSQEQEEYLDICDSYYNILLKAIEISLTLGEASQTQLVAAAVRVMVSLDEMASVLAQQGYLPRFQLASDAPSPTQKSGNILSAVYEFGKAASGGIDLPTRAVNQLDSRYAQLQNSLSTLSSIGSAEAKRRAAEHKLHLAQHMAEIDSILLQDVRARMRPN